MVAMQGPAEPIAFVAEIPLSTTKDNVNVEGAYVNPKENINDVGQRQPNDHF